MSNTLEWAKQTLSSINTMSKDELNSALTRALGEIGRLSHQSSAGHSAQQMAEIANTINNHLHTVFKNNSSMVTKLAIAVFEAQLVQGQEAASFDQKIGEKLKELENLKAYCRSVTNEMSRAIYMNGELVGYWQSSEWIQELLRRAGVEEYE